MMRNIFKKIAVLSALSICMTTNFCHAQSRWSRVEYKVLNTEEKANSGLFGYTCEEGVTNHLLELVVSGKVNAYRYNLNGREPFKESEGISPKEVLLNYNITFEEDEMGNLSVSCHDLPTESVTLYYIRESLFYQEENGSFRRCVDAICPVIVENGQRYPMFWLKIKDLEPFAKQLSMPISGSSLADTNLIAFMNRGLYNGKLYMVLGNPNQIECDSVQHDDFLKKIKRMVYDN